MIFVLPIDSSSQNYDFQTTLDGAEYTLEVHFNQRASAFFLSILDGSGNPLLMGRKIVVGSPMLARFHGNPALPPGEIIALDLSGQDLDPQATVNPDGTISGDLGSRVIVYYIDRTTMELSLIARAITTSWAEAVALLQQGQAAVYAALATAIENGLDAALAKYLPSA